MKRKQTQSEMILAALSKGARLTALDALKRFRCFRLAARIRDLRKAGHAIQSRQVKGQPYHVYWI